MNGILIGTVGLDLAAEEWLEKRRAGIGGSDAPAIAGAVSWASPMSVYLDKLGLVEREEPNEAMEWGSRHEPTIIKKFEEVSGHLVCGRQELHAHPEYPWMLATIDGVFLDDAKTPTLYEGKTSSAWKSQAWKDDVPLYVWIQVQHNLAVTGCASAVVAALIGGNHYEQHAIARDETYIATLIELERAFVENHLAPQVPPAIDGSKASEAALKVLFPEDDGTSIVIDDSAAEALARDLLVYQDEEKQMADHVRETANALKALLGEAQRASIGNYRVSWPTVVTKRLDTKAARAGLGEALEPYMAESTSRRFTVKEVDG